MQESIRRLTDAIGFRYHFDEATNQFAHGSAIYVATPQGKLARYFYGIEYSPKDLATRAGGSFGKQDWLAGGSVAALLLSLRSGHRKIWRGSNEHGARRGVTTLVRNGCDVLRDAPSNSVADATAHRRDCLA